MTNEDAKRIIEAVLFASDKPLTIEALKGVVEELEPHAIEVLVDELNQEYRAANRSFGIKAIAGGYQMLTDPLYREWVAKMYKRPPDKLSGPALETLSIIAYKQPITRSEIEAIRGVNVDGVIHTLEERGLVRTRGRKDVVGRPILYGTTNEFLQYFGLKSLEELPRLREFQESDLDFIKDKRKEMLIDTATGRRAEGPRDRGADAPATDSGTAASKAPAGEPIEGPGKEEKGNGASYEIGEIAKGD